MSENLLNIKVVVSNSAIQKHVVIYCINLQEKTAKSEEKTVCAPHECDSEKVTQVGVKVVLTVHWEEKQYMPKKQKFLIKCLRPM